MNIKDFGFDKFLRRVLPSDNTPIKTRTTATELSGGILKSAGDIEIGSKLFTMSGEDSNIIVNDGSKDRILIGKRKDGTYGIDVSSAGYSVFDAYEGEMDLTSKATDDWTELNASNFAYSTANKITISNYIGTSIFQIGDRIKLTQTTAKYFVVGRVETDYIMVYGGSDYTVANAAITNLYFSREVRPSGFPAYFNYTASPTVVESGGPQMASQTISNEEHRFTMLGNRVDIYGRFTATITLSGATPALVHVLTNKPVPNVATFTGTYIVQQTAGDGGSLWYIASNYALSPIALISYSTTQIRWGSNYNKQSYQPLFLLGNTWPLSVTFYPNNYYLI